MRANKIYQRDGAASTVGSSGSPGARLDAFEEAAEAVERALKEKRIGTAVTTRVVAVLDEDHGRIEARGARILEACAGWLQGSPDQITAFGGVEHGQISILARFPRGGSALVSVATHVGGEPILGIGVWGDLGALAWEAGGQTRREPVGGEAAMRLRAWIAESLRSKRTIHLRDGAVAVAVSGGEVDAPRAEDVGKGGSTRPRKKTEPPYGVLLIAGDGTHQDYFGPTFAKDPRCRVVGLTDEAGVTPSRAEQNEALAKRMGIPILADLDEALRRPDVQIVSIAAEPSRSAAIIERAARAGKHLYLDNLVADRIEAADRLVAAVRSANVVSQTWGIANSALADRMRASIRSGAVGDLTAVHQDYIFARAGTYPFAGPEGGAAELGRPRREVETPRFDWFAGTRREMASVGSYALVRLLSLVGRRIHRVRAVTGNFFFRHHQAQDVEDFGQILMEFEGGAVATLSAGLVGNAWHPTGEFDVTYLLGSRIALAFDGDRPRVEVWAGPGVGEPRPPTSYWYSPFSVKANDDIGRFLDAVAAGHEAESPAWRAAEALEVLIAAYRSAESGEVVTLPLPRG